MYPPKFSVFQILLAQKSRSFTSTVVAHKTYNKFCYIAGPHPHLLYPVNSGITLVEVELEGLEPSTLCLQSICAPIAPQPHMVVHASTDLSLYKYYPLAPLQRFKCFEFSPKRSGDSRVKAESWDLNPTKACLKNRRVLLLHYLGIIMK